jgi:hypothetical protein
MATKTSNRNVASEIAFLTRALKAPSLADSVERLAERARAESWTHEESSGDLPSPGIRPPARIGPRSRGDTVHPGDPRCEVASLS